MSEAMNSDDFSICIIGAGIGGLACAVACRRQGLHVQVLEQAPEILPIGAGIQVPPNATRVLDSLGVLPAMMKTAIEVKTITMRRYNNGDLLTERPVRNSAPWLVIHRADYHEALLDEAQRLGAEVKLGSKVSGVDFDSGVAHVEKGGSVKADVIIGADGLWSNTRSAMLGRESEPYETGDLAYRGTFTLEQLEELKDPRITNLCTTSGVTVWIGPDKHCVFYPVRGGKQFNMILIRPDNLPSGARTVTGDIGEMRQTFVGWDDVLTKIISCIPSVLKWKLLHHDELDQWVKGCTALLGDACHPTLPYQAQGAAMAVEDGAVIGNMLGYLNKQLRIGAIPRSARQESIREVLILYENCQKLRSTTNVRGAVNNRTFYHVHDGPEQEERDEILARHTFTTEKSHYLFCDMPYHDDLLETDVIGQADKIFKTWVSSHSTRTEVFAHKNVGEVQV